MDYIFFDIGYTLVNEDKAWEQRCIEQSQTPQAIALGITPEQLMRDIECASVELKSPFNSVMEKYGFSNKVPYRSEYEILYEDTIDVLQKLSKRFCLGIIANQSDDLLSRLKAFKIDKYFTTVISSADYTFSKPDKRLFIAALEQSGCTAKNAIMVGDRLDNDIMPANLLGFTTVWIKRGFAAKQTPPSEIYVPNYTINTLSELLSMQILQ